MFEISDRKVEINKLEKNKTYKLEEVLPHNELFEAYPKLRKMIIKTKDFKKGKNGETFVGQYDTVLDRIFINNELIDTDTEGIRNTILHEVQHKIQEIEGLESGSESKNLIRYYTSLGEIQSTDVEMRSRLDYSDIKKKAPEVSKEFPIHQQLQEIHKNINKKSTQKYLQKNPKVAELYNEIYNNGNEGEYDRAKINKKGTTNNISKKDEILHKIREWLRVEGNYKSLQRELDNSSFFDDLIADAKFHNAEDLTEVTTGYENVPDNLLGFSKNGQNKGYFEEKYKYKLDLMISFDDGKTYFEDSIKGLNKKQAIERARRNWGEDAILKANPSSEDTDIRYSLSDKGTLQDSNGNEVTLEASDTGTHGTLMAIHNLNEGKLKGVIELGGFPVPSIAVTNPNLVNHKQFGDISVLFDKNTIDPSNKLNEVYDRDVWSPTFPKIDSEINNEKLESVAEEIGIKDYYLEDIAERNSNIEDLIYQVKRHDEVIRKYLDKNNIEYNADLDTYKELRELATTNGLDSYLKEQLSNIIGTKGIYNGKEYLTPSGNRRTFWQLHDKYTLENLVKNLTKGKTTGTQQTLFGAGFGPTSANMNNQFKSIEDIKKAESRIVSSEEQQKQQIPYIANLEKAMKPLRQYAVEGVYTSGSEQVYNVIQELSEQKKVNVANLIKILNEHGFNNVNTISQETLQNVIDALNDLKNMPTDYFEAKPQRAVGLDEVQAIVIPNTTSAEFKQQLQDAGLKYYEYDSNIEGDRQRVINQFEDLKFSKQNEDWQSFLDNNFESKGTKTRLSDIKLPGLTNTVQEEVQTEVQKSLLPIANELKELNKNLNKVLNPNEISQLTPQDANTTPILPGINRNKVGDGKSKFFDNIKDKTNMLNDEVKTTILSSDEVKYYDKVTNKDSLEEAYARLQENGTNEVLRWLNNENITSTDVA